MDWKYGLWNPAKLSEHFFASHCRLWYDRLGALAGFIAGTVIRDCVRRGTKRGIKAVQISGLNENTIRLYASFGRHHAVTHLEYTKPARP